MIFQGTGGANTKSGLVFEGKTDLATFFATQKGYSVDGEKLFYKSDEVARIYKKHEFYKKFINGLGIDWQKIFSAQLVPDNTIFVLVANTLFIVECKFQQVSGSVDEKLQTCDFKRKQYQRLLASANIEVEYVYLLSDWFRHERYRDVLAYVISVNCHYFFNYIPLVKFGLPVPDNN